MPKLTTDFIKIAQSGPCIDGRLIEAQWLRDMADTYDPATYTAYIWPDHIRWGNNYGKVLALRAQEDKGVVSLQASLAPNAQYVWENQFDQLLHFSIEVAENFAGSGKAYLAGLGITDSPASLGTDALKFSLRRIGQDISIFSNVPAVPLQNAEEKVPGWFTSLMQKFTPQNQEDSMTPEQFAALSAKVDALHATMESIKVAFSTAVQQGTAQEHVADTLPVEGASHSAAQPKAEGSPTFAAELSQALAPVQDGMQKLSVQVEEMRKRFESTKPGTLAPPSTGPAADGPLL